MVLFCINGRRRPIANTLVANIKCIWRLYDNPGRSCNNPSPCGGRFTENVSGGGGLKLRSMTLTLELKLKLEIGLFSLSAIGFLMIGAAGALSKEVRNSPSAEKRLLGW